MRAHLLIIGDRSGLAWVLEHERMAFAEHRRQEAMRVAVGDDFLLYTTRGCFHNPTRDRGRVIGRARVESSVTRFDVPVTIGGRDFTLGCAIRLEQLLPRGQGVELSTVVSELSVFPKPHAWSAALRRSVLSLPPSDFTLLRSRLGRSGTPRRAALNAVPTYLP